MAKKSSSSSSSSSKLTYYIKAPYRALISARDLYVNSLGGCAGRVQQGRVIPSRVPRSQSHGFYSSRSGRGEDDIAELIRAASQGRLGPMGIRLTDTTAGGAMPRSQSAGVASVVRHPVRIDRIDEAEEGSDVDGSSHGGSYPRSRSCAVVPTGRVGAGMLGVVA